VRRFGQKATLRVLTALVCGLLLPPVTFACTLVFQRFDVPRSFSIQVSQSGEPIPGLILEIKDGHAINPPTLYVKRTDSKGIARVEDLVAGLYEIHLGRDTAFQNLFEIQVHAKSNERTVPLVKVDWIGFETVFRTERFEGRLREQVLSIGEERFAPRPFLANTEIRILEGRTRKVVTSTVTGDDGSFKVKDLRPGIYQVEIRSQTVRPQARAGYGFDGQGSFPLEIRRGVSGGKRPFDLLVSSTGCGLAYYVEYKEEPGNP